MNNNIEKSKEQFRLNKKVSLKNSISYFLKNVLVGVLIVSGAYSLLTLKNNTLSPEYFWIASVSILGVNFFQARKFYKDLALQLDVKTFITNIETETNDKRSVVGRLNKQYRYYDQRTEELKLKLDLFKSFSPIPLVVFILTLMQGNTITFLFDANIFKSISFLSLHSIFTFSVLIFITWYTATVIQTWFLYKRTNGIKYLFLISLENAKE